MKNVQTVLDCVGQFAALADANEAEEVSIETAGMYCMLKIYT